jgi:cytochrome c553
MNFPVMGLTRDDPGKFVLGTVPVEEDGSAYFHVPSGVAFFMQALDEEGMAVQTMRSATYLQPGQRFTCIGCHEQRHTAPPNAPTLAANRPPSRIVPGPKGTWPLDYQALVQPVLEEHCVRCHQPNTEGAKFDLTAEVSYDTLVQYGSPSLKDHVVARYQEGHSTAGACAARQNPLWKILEKGHFDTQLSSGDRERLVTWMDTYAQRLGSFDPGQEQRLHQLKRNMDALLAK